MKRAIRNILTVTSFFLSWFYPYRILKYTKILFLYKIYSFAIKQQCKQVGANLSIEPSLVLDGAKHIILGNNVSIRGRCWIGAYDEYFGYRYSPSLTIGDNVIINFNCHIACINSITIGNDTLVSSDVLISDHTHGEISNRTFDSIRRTQPLVSKGAIVIGNNVWIGEKVSILSNVCIGDNSIIGANSVVTKNIPANCIVAGNPAKIIREIR
ncbi:MAG: acyltransferase [Campylobacterales bacterium]|nr:acyltransferase [Campylobacterales bacterium]